MTLASSCLNSACLNSAALSLSWRSSSTNFCTRASCSLMAPNFFVFSSCASSTRSSTPATFASSCSSRVYFSLSILA